MPYDESGLHYCNECGSEFVIQAIEAEDQVTYCPYCGSDLYDQDKDVDDEDDENHSWN